MFNVQKDYIHNDQILTALSIKYTNAEFVGKQFLPDIRVQKETGLYRIYSREGWFKGAPKKADGAITEEATLAYDEGTYSCYERAIKDIVTDRAVRQADAPVQPKMDTTEFLSEKILLGEEIDTWLLVTGTSGLDQANYRQTLDATSAWVDGTNPDILGDLSTGIKAISLAIGKKPNLIAFDTEVAEAVAQDDKILEILKYHSRDMVVGNPLPPTLRAMKVVIADALYNSADEGVTASYEYVISDNAVMAFVDPRNPLTLGRNFVAAQNRVARWRDEDRQGEFIKVNKVYSPKITTLAAGWLIKNCKNA
jgi:hypothetical protein